MSQLHMRVIIIVQLRITINLLLIASKSFWPIGVYDK